jgi:small subunit ribosomal protein S5
LRSNSTLFQLGDEMSVARPARCLLPRRFAAASIKPARSLCCACFHSSARLETRRRPRFKSIRAEELGLTTPEKVEKFTQENFQPYTAEEIEVLKKYYTPEQMEALEAGEAAIDPKDLTIQARLRRDPYKLLYLDDFSRIIPTIDKRPKKPSKTDPRTRFMSEEQMLLDLTHGPVIKPESVLESVTDREFKRLPLKQQQSIAERIMNEVFAKEKREAKMTTLSSRLAQMSDAELAAIPDEKTQELIDEFEKEANMVPEIEMPDISPRRIWEKIEDRVFQEFPHERKDHIVKQILQDMTEKRRRIANLKPEDEQEMWEGGRMTTDGMNQNTALAPGLGTDIPGVSGMFKSPIDPADMGLDDEGIYQDLKRRTGLTVKEILGLTVKVLVSRQVSNQTRLGKIRSSWVLAIAGNRDGRLGIGQAKSVENGTAVQKAKLLAIRNMQPIPRYEERTIYGSVEAKFGSTIVKLDARPPGQHTPPRFKSGHC